MSTVVFNKLWNNEAWSESGFEWIISTSFAGELEILLFVPLMVYSIYLLEYYFKRYF